MQRLALADRHFPALLRGDKIQTVRWREGRVGVGPLVFYSETESGREVEVWVTRCTRMPLGDVAAFLSKTKEWPDDVMLAGMRAHYPGISLRDVVDVIEHLSPEETRSRRSSVSSPPSS
jgi:hypothetical protein